MTFVVLMIVIIFLGILFIAGLIFLIAGIITKKNPKNKGKAFPVVFIVIGSLLLVLPAGTALTMIVTQISSSVTTKIESMSYENVTDKWRNEWTTDRSAANGAIEELLSCADSGNRERFAKTFTPNIQQSAGFEEYLEEFFNAYPVGMWECTLDGGNVSSSGSYNYGHNVQTGSTSYTCVLNGEWYHIAMNFCYENTDCPEDVGVTFFAIENLEARALDKNYGDKPLVCSKRGKNEISARLIKNNAFVFEPTPDRVITEEEMKQYLAECNDLYTLSKKIGEPNVNKKYPNCTGYDHYYELAPENGEPRYAYLCTNSPTGRFYSGYICSDTGSFYDRGLLSEK